MNNEPELGNIDRWLLAHFPRRVVVIGYSIMVGIAFLFIIALILAAIALFFLVLLVAVELLRQGYAGAVIIAACVVVVGVFAVVVYKEIDKDLPKREKKTDDPA